jgi:hypothetical protein
MGAALLRSVSSDFVLRGHQCRNQGRRTEKRGPTGDEVTGCRKQEAVGELRVTRYERREARGKDEGGRMNDEEGRTKNQERGKEEG